MLESLLCGLILTLQVEAHGVEDDGTHNHLLVTNRAPRHVCENNPPIERVVKISYSGPKQLAKEGEYITIKVDAECFSGYGVDESFKNFWVTYRVWLCDATSIKVLK